MVFARETHAFALVDASDHKVTVLLCGAVPAKKQCIDFAPPPRDPIFTLTPFATSSQLEHCVKNERRKRQQLFGGREERTWDEERAGSELRAPFPRNQFAVHASRRGLRRGMIAAL